MRTKRATGLILFTFGLTALLITCIGCNEISLSQSIPEKFTIPKNSQSLFLAEIKNARLAGKSILKKGKYKLKAEKETWALKIEKENIELDYLLAYHLKEAKIGNDKIDISPNIKDFSFSLSSPITIVTPDGIELQVDKISMDEKRESIVVLAKSKLFKSLGNIFVYALFKGDESSGEDIAKLPFFQVDPEAGFSANLMIDIDGGLVSKTIKSDKRIDINKKLKINPPQITDVGSLNLKADVYYSNDNKDLLLKAKADKLATVLLKGTENIDIEVALYDFNFSFDSANNIGKASIKVNINSKNNVEVYYKARPALVIGPVKAGTLTEKAVLRPFNVSVEYICDVNLVGDSLVFTLKQWSQIGNDKYCVWFKSDNWGIQGTGCAKLTDKKIAINSQFLNSIPIKFGKDNEIKKKLDEQIGKQFKLKIG